MKIPLGTPLGVLPLRGNKRRPDVPPPTLGAVYKAGGQIVSFTVQAVAHPAKVLCACCLSEEEQPSGIGSCGVVCSRCGAPFVAMLRPFPLESARWVTFNPF